MSFLPDVYFKLIEQPGFENSIVAGGFIRDSVMGGPIKDLDIFIPCTNQEDFIKKVKTLEGTGILEVNTKEITQDDYSFDTKFAGKYDGKAGQIDIDLCGYIYLQKHPFGFAESVLDSFHYDIDQGYSTGAYPIVTVNQQRDINNRTATLARIKDPGNILHCVRKFDRLQAKYPDLRFNCQLDIRERNPNGPALADNDFFDIFDAA